LLTQASSLAAVINSQISTYSYNGQGGRVKAVTPTGSVSFVYGAAGLERRDQEASL